MDLVDIIILQGIIILAVLCLVRWYRDWGPAFIISGPVLVCGWGLRHPHSTISAFLAGISLTAGAVLLGFWFDKRAVRRSDKTEVKR